eukprot:1161504-Pelagomonas_calceolata.AAC.9
MQQKDGQCNNGYAYREWLHQGLHTEGGHVGPEASELGHDAHSSQPHQPRLAHLCMSDVEEFAHPCKHTNVLTPSSADLSAI